MLLARAEAEDFEDDIEGTEDHEYPKIGNTFRCYARGCGHGASKLRAGMIRRL